MKQERSPSVVRGIADDGVGRFAFVLCDVFAERPLAGNQLAVFPAAIDIPDELLQKIARETNFSEVTFVYPPQHGGTARVRIFEPTHETPFAGHPVLGTAVVLGISTGSTRVMLETGRGNVTVTLQTTQRGGWGTMLQPTPTVSAFPAAPRLLEALGLRTSVLPVELYDNGTPHVYVTLPSREAVQSLAPDRRALSQLARSVAIPFLGINCVAGAGTRWKTRMFAPGAGIDEDPATGSAAGPLSYHLQRHGVIASGTEIRIEQGEEIGRPSVLHAATVGTPDGPRISVSGKVFIVGRGTLEL